MNLEKSVNYKRDKRKFLLVGMENHDYHVLVAVEPKNIIKRRSSPLFGSCKPKSDIKEIDEHMSILPKPFTRTSKELH